VQEPYSRDFRLESSQGIAKERGEQKREKKKIRIQVGRQQKIKRDVEE